MDDVSQNLEYSGPARPGSWGRDLCIRRVEELKPRGSRVDPVALRSLAAFTPDGRFTDESIGLTYRIRDRAYPLENYGRAFSDMHRELYRLYVNGDIVVVQLALQGTHDGPLSMAGGGALEAGTDPTLVAGWTAEVTATRAAAQAELRAATGSRGTDLDPEYMIVLPEELLLR
jgi:hypothetical protein